MWEVGYAADQAITASTEHINSKRELIPQGQSLTSTSGDVGCNIETSTREAARRDGDLKAANPPDETDIPASDMQQASTESTGGNASDQHSGTGDVGGAGDDSAESMEQSQDVIANGKDEAADAAAKQTERTEAMVDVANEMVVCSTSNTSVVAQAVAEDEGDLNEIKMLKGEYVSESISERREAESESEGYNANLMTLAEWAQGWNAARTNYLG